MLEECTACIPTIKEYCNARSFKRQQHADALAGAQLRPAPPAEAPAPPCAPLFLSPSKALDTTGRIAAANAQLSAFRAALTKACSPI